MLPAHLVDEYWQEVEQELTSRFEHARAPALRGIEEYRRKLAQHDVGDIQYNADPKAIAAAIDAGIRFGFPDAAEVKAIS